MTKLRYLIAGLIACLIHGIALSYTPKKNTINVSTEQGNQSLQIQLIAKAATKPEPVVEKKEVEPESQKIEPIEQKKPEPKPVKKPEKPKPKPKKPKVIEKKKPQPEVEVKKPAVEPKTDIEPKVVKEAEPTKPKPIEEKQAPPAQTASQASKPMLVKKAEFSAKPTPVTYPRLARKKGLQGKVMIEVWLDEQGKQVKQVLLESSGHNVLDERALNTIKEWRFSKRIEQGKAIAHRVHIPINFQLQ